MKVGVLSPRIYAKTTTNCISITEINEAMTKIDYS